MNYSELRDKYGDVPRLLAVKYLYGTLTEQKIGYYDTHEWDGRSRKKLIRDGVEEGLFEVGTDSYNEGCIRATEKLVMIVVEKAQSVSKECNFALRINDEWSDIWTRIIYYHKAMSESGWYVTSNVVDFRKKVYDMEPANWNERSLMLVPPMVVIKEKDAFRQKIYLDNISNFLENEGVRVSDVITSLSEYPKKLSDELIALNAQKDTILKKIAKLDATMEEVVKHDWNALEQKYFSHVDNLVEENWG